MKSKNILLLMLMIFVLSNLANAQLTFQKLYGGSNDDYGNKVQQTSDSGYIILGDTYSFGNISGDIFLTKTDADGNVQWRKIYEGNGSDNGNDIQQTSDGGYIITGFTSSFNNSSGVAYLIKTDANGDTLWTKAYGNPGGSGLSVQQTSDGGYIVAGNDNTWPGDFYVVKTTASGDTLWTKTYGGQYVDYCNSVLQTYDGGYIFGGVSDKYNSGNYNMCLIKTTANGDTLWTKSYEGIYSADFTRAQQTSDSGYILACNTSAVMGNEDFCLVKTNSVGDTLWTKTYGGPDFENLHSALQTSDGGYLLAGSTRSFGAGLSDVYLVKTLANGDTLWTRAFGAAGEEWSLNALQTNDGGYIITGSMFSSFSDSTDIFLIKTDAYGNSSCNQANTATVVGKLALQYNGSAAIVKPAATVIGSFPVNIDSAGTETTLCTTTGINETQTANVFSIYPNPGSDIFTIELKTGFTDGIIKIFNTLGALVYEQTINQAVIVIHPEVPEGIYFVTVSDREKMHTQKLIIQ